VLALDYGSARTGVAISDPSGTIATPVGVVERAATSDGLAQLEKIVREQDVERVVVGLPLTPRGEVGEQARETLAFAEALGELLSVPSSSTTSGSRRRSRRARRRRRGGRPGGRVPPGELPARAVGA
jgi:putative Holliday junction resolvase